MRNLCQTYLEAQVTVKEKKDPLSSLSPREDELFKLVVAGIPNKEIAKRLSISDNTVRNHIASIFSKLKVNNRTEAAFLYHQNEIKKHKAGLPAEDIGNIRDKSDRYSWIGSGE